MYAAGIDVSKDDSTVAVIQPFGVVIAEPYKVRHTESDLRKLADYLKSLPGETKVIMEYTGHYYEPIARYLHNEGIFVSVVNAILIANYNENTTVRKVKTDPKDALKIANWGIDRWLKLPEYIPAEDSRQKLKLFNRQYIEYSKVRTMLKNNFIALLDQVFPRVNTFFSSPVRKSDGHEKWIDFAMQFWHKECVSRLSLNAFKKKYAAWCRREGYNYSEAKATEIHEISRSVTATLPCDESIRRLITISAGQLVEIEETVNAILREMSRLASQLPEYDTVMKMYGTGEILGAQLMAEIGDIRCFSSKQALVGFAGIDPPPKDSGKIEGNTSGISKRGSPYLRRTLFLIMTVILQNSPESDPVYQYLDRKRAEGKPYKVYMIAAANKFLRIYYARVKAVMDSAFS